LSIALCTAVPHRSNWNLKVVIGTIPMNDNNEFQVQEGIYVVVYLVFMVYE